MTVCLHQQYKWYGLAISLNYPSWPPQLLHEILKHFVSGEGHRFFFNLVDYYLTPGLLVGGGRSLNIFSMRHFLKRKLSSCMTLHQIAYKFLKENVSQFLCTRAFLYAPYSLLLISNKFWMGRGRVGN